MNDLPEQIEGEGDEPEPVEHHDDSLVAATEELTRVTRKLTTVTGGHLVVVGIELVIGIAEIAGWVSKLH
ncbi:hypothetical protein AB0F71_30960 [Kitasatospora sp. NPDC028055]|uniref:hypothetical protein n=1 Tax=Kitasatospora sp. NPDC028055 TaxID=3155653 RepID=UPI0033E7BE4B